MQPPNKKKNQFLTIDNIKTCVYLILKIEKPS